MTTGEGAPRSTVEVSVDPETAFRIFVTRIADWWHRDGPYWNDSDRRLEMRMQPGPGGRLVEVYDAASGEGFEVGRVVGWAPGHRLAFLWRQSDWPPQEMTEVDVTFEPIEHGTRVTLTHEGWERLLSDPTASDGYQEGWDELLGWYAEVAGRPASQ